MSLSEAERIERATYLGGTDMAALAGLSRWARPIDVWQEKVGPPAPEQQSTMMALGALLEATVAKLFTEATGRWTRRTPAHVINDYTITVAGQPVVVPGHYCTVMRDARYPYLGGHPDRYVDGGLLECKWSMGSDGWGASGMVVDLGSDAAPVVPPAYAVQVQHYLGITDRPVGYLAVLLGYADFRWYTVLRHDETIELLRRLGEEFWADHVLAGVPPDPDGSDGYSAWLRRQRADKERHVPATPAQVLMAAALETSQLAALAALRETAVAEQRLQLSMGSTSRLDLGGGRTIHWAEQNRSTVHWEELALAAGADRARLEALRADHTTVSTSRPFRVPWPTTIKGLEESENAADT